MSSNCSMLDNSMEAMDQFYPNYWSGSIVDTESICIPACHDIFKTAYHGATDCQARGYDEKTFKQRQNFHKGNKAENAFLRKFQKLKIGGILISGFDSAEYIERRRWNKKRLLDRFGIKDVEVDAIFVHPSLGIFIFEIKGTRKGPGVANLFESPGYLKAVEQLKKFEEQIPKIFTRLCNSTNCNVPIYLAICFPFAFLNGSKHKNAFINIDQSYFIDENKMKQLFLSRMKFQPESKDHLEDLKKFTCAVAGYRSLEFVSAGRNALAVHNLIDSQSFKEAGKAKTTTDTDIFLTNEQLEILDCNDRHQIIWGPPGTGKTLILLQKALTAAQTVKEGSRVCVTAPRRALRMKFMEYFMQFEDTIVRPVVVGFHFTHLNPEDEAYIDEYSISLTDESISGLKIKLIQCARSVTVITGALSPLQIQNIPVLLSKHELDRYYRYFPMDTVIRSSKENFSEWKSEFSKTKIRIGHNFCGPCVKRITAWNSDQILQNILQIITAMRQQIGADFCANLAIITNEKESLDVINEFLSSNGISCGSAEEQIRKKHTVAVSNVLNTVSLEWPFVIMVSFSALEYHANFALLAASRCISQLYIIERDYLSVQAIIEEKFIDLCNQRNVSMTDRITMFKIVCAADEEFGETSLSVHSLYFVFALIRQNTFLIEMKLMGDYFQHCNTLFDCFRGIVKYRSLCEWLLKNKKLWENIMIYKVGLRLMSDSPSKLFSCLRSHRSTTETQEFWAILVELHCKLVAMAEPKFIHHYVDKQSIACELLKVFSNILCVLFY